MAARGRVRSRPFDEPANPKAHRPSRGAWAVASTHPSAFRLTESARPPPETDSNTGASGGSGWALTQVKVPGTHPFVKTYLRYSGDSSACERPEGAARRVDCPACQPTGEVIPRRVWCERVG